MDKTHLKQIFASILPGEEIPKPVLAKAGDLVLHSSSKISLKPNEEPARAYICCVIAVELMKERFDLASPSLSQPPIPPAQIKKLLALFRRDLVPASPQKPKRASSRVSTPSRKRTVAVPDSDFEDESDFEVVSSPVKQRSVTPSGTPSKRARNVAGEPDQAYMTRFITALDVQETTSNAILRGYKQYNGLVKDKWGLLMGIAWVVIHRAEPDKTEGLEATLRRETPGLVSQERLDEWIGWAKRIITGQSWIAQISVAPEPVKELYGGVGAWGFKLA